MRSIKGIAMCMIPLIAMAGGCGAPSDPASERLQEAWVACKSTGDEDVIEKEDNEATIVVKGDADPTDDEAGECMLDNLKTSRKAVRKIQDMPDSPEQVYYTKEDGVYYLWSRFGDESILAFTDTLPDELGTSEIIKK